MNSFFTATFGLPLRKLPMIVSNALAHSNQNHLASWPRVYLLSGHLRFVGIVLIALALARLGLMAWLHDRIHSPRVVLLVLRNGLRMDLIGVCYAVAPAVLLSLAFGGTHRVGRLLAKVQRVYFSVMTMAFLYMEFVTPAFIMEFDSRPNRLFIEYLVHPKEVGSMLLTGYKLEIAITTVLTLAAIWFAWTYFRGKTQPNRATSVPARVALTLIALPLIFLGARSSLQHRPANPSSVAFSQDHLVNDLCLNSIYSVAYAVTQMRSEADAGDAYGFLPEAEMIGVLREAMVTATPGSFQSDELPTLHHQMATGNPAKPLNLVILLQESLGAQFVGALGGEPVTQYLDTLATEGWWFDQMYASGTRSVRGIEAVVAGFLPTPARSTVKLGLSQQGFFTIAEYLGERGYRTQFVYGGESHFDNMKRFFTGNGFKEIVDQDDFEDPIFTGSWGVCDEDILNKTHDILMKATDKPIFTMAFSVSNHSPWEYPEGRFEPYESDPATRNNSVRYADYALGQFFEKAKRSPYWDNTIIVVVADPDSRVYGASLVPIEHFHIPAVIIGPGVPKKRDSRVASQFDLPPTLLSLLGLSGEHPMIGHDLTALPEDHPGRAIMQYGSTQAYMEGERVVVMRPQLPASQFTWDGSGLTKDGSDPLLQKRALAHALIPSWLYRKQRYRMQSTNPPPHAKLAR